jgi:hypothetical protein
VPDLLSSKIRSGVGGLSREFADALPFRHVVINSFLDPDFCGRLMAEFPCFDERKAIDEAGTVGRKAVVSDITGIGPAFREFDALMRDRKFLSLISEIGGIPDVLYDPDYAGGGTHENLDGQDLDVHVDFNYHPRNLLHRRLNLIVFLNPEWGESWGGCLELRSDPWDAGDANRKTILPLLNRAVLFETTEKSWHGFTRISLPPEKRNLSRRSIAVYFYTRERPSGEVAPSHGTIYIPRPLPAHLEAGYTLRQEDVDLLQILTERRNSQIRFLYEREIEFSEAIAEITTSLSFRIGRFLTYPIRKLRGQRKVP